MSSPIDPELLRNARAIIPSDPALAYQLLVGLGMDQIRVVQEILLTQIEFEVSNPNFNRLPPQYQFKSKRFRLGNMEVVMRGNAIDVGPFRAFFQSSSQTLIKQEVEDHILDFLSRKAIVIQSHLNH